MAVQAGIMPCQVIQQPGAITEPCLVGLIAASLSAELSRRVELPSTPAAVAVAK